MFELPVETAQIEGIGEVTLRGLTFSGRVALHEAAESQHRGMFLPELLASVVESPKLTAAEWDVFGGVHQEQFVELTGIAMRLAGLDQEDAEKKAESTSSP